MRKLACLFTLMLVLQGCSRETQSDVKELGNDMKRDVNKAAQEVDAAVQDAVD